MNRPIVNLPLQPAAGTQQPAVPATPAVPPGETPVSGTSASAAPPAQPGTHPPGRHAASATPITGVPASPAAQAFQAGQAHHEAQAHQAGQAHHEAQAHQAGQVPQSAYALQARQALQAAPALQGAQAAQAAAPAAAQAAPAAAAPAAPTAPAAPVALAGTGTPPGAGTAQAEPREPRGRRSGFRFGLAQIICWQLVVVAIMMAAGGSLPVLIGTIVGSLGLIAATALPVRGTWLHQWAVIALRYLLRTRRVELPESKDAAPTMLRPWIGGNSIDATVVRDKSLALISSSSGTSGLLRLESDGDAPSAGGTTFRYALTTLLGENGGNDGAGSILDVLDEQPVDLDLQLVVHAGLRHDREPRCWLAVAGRRSAAVSTDEQLAMVVRNAVRRVQRHLERAGSVVTPVDDADAATTLIALAHAGAGRGHLRERWSTWSAGPVTQTCLRLTGFTRLAPELATALVDTLTGTAVNASVTLSAGLRIGHKSNPAGTKTAARHDPVIRVAAASSGALDVATTVLGRLARAYGVQPERLDGRQGLGTAASLPIARALV